MTPSGAEWLHLFGFTAHVLQNVYNYLYVLPFVYLYWKVYFASIGKKTIERVDLNSGSRQVLVSDGLDSPEGLAIDWVHRRMYWTDNRCVDSDQCTCGRWFSA